MWFIKLQLCPQWPNKISVQTIHLHLIQPCCLSRTLPCQKKQKKTKNIFSLTPLSVLTCHSGSAFINYKTIAHKYATTSIFNLKHTQLSFQESLGSCRGADTMKSCLCVPSQYGGLFVCLQPHNQTVVSLSGMKRSGNRPWALSL